MTGGSPEAEVVAALKRFLVRGGLRGLRPSRVLVDADPSYLRSRFSDELEPLARVQVGGARPDVLCSFEQGHGAWVVGFEVKARAADWYTGIAQARRYRSGVHQSYLALPGRAAATRSDAIAAAQELGVGVLLRDSSGWKELVAAPNPTPHHAELAVTTRLLEGVPVARRLQLNHPLNYLVVPLLAAQSDRQSSLLEELETHWPTLGTPGTRRHAVVGAATLGLVDMDGAPTLQGLAVADLLQAVGFELTRPPSRRGRLAHVAVPIAAIARFVLLQQPAVQLIVKSLWALGGKSALPEVALRAAKLDGVLAGALFLTDPSADVRPGIEGRAYNPSTVYKLKQALWHAGVLATGAHSSAGGKSDGFLPAQDVWALEPGTSLAFKSPAF